MKKYIICFGVLMVMLSYSTITMAQDSSATEAPKPKPVHGTFAGPVLIDNQTIMMPNKGSFSSVFEHRFGNLEHYSDMFGLFNISSILIGVNYVPIKNVQVGLGICSYNMTWNLNLKLNLMQQQKNGGWPVSISYYGDAAMDSRDKSNFVSESDRFTYFNEIMIARKITDKFSAQIAPSVSYFCDVPAYRDGNGQIQSTMENTQFAFAAIGRYKLTPTTGIVVDYDQPLTQNVTTNPHPNLSGGVEFETSGHTFQIFVTNFGYCLPQYNAFLNQNDYTKKGGFLIGFNITRL